MKFWPSETFTLSTMLSPQEAAARIAAETEPFKMLRIERTFGKPAAHYFEGEASGARFEVRRIIGRRNSFLPIVKGEIEPAPGRGALVRIKMGLSSFVWAFIGVWTAFVSFFCVAFLAAGLHGDPDHDLWVFMPFGMLAFMYAMMIFGFWIEAPKQKQKLIEIFQAEQERP